MELKLRRFMAMEGEREQTKNHRMLLCKIKKNQKSMKSNDRMVKSEIEKQKEILEKNNELHTKQYSSKWPKNKKNIFTINNQKSKITVT